MGGQPSSLRHSFCQQAREAATCDTSGSAFQTGELFPPLLLHCMPTFPTRAAPFCNGMCSMPCMVLHSFSLPACLSQSNLTCQSTRKDIENLGALPRAGAADIGTCAQGSQQQAGTLRHRFDDVRPTLLLFLQRLQCIIVNDTTADETSIMIRQACSLLCASN